MSPQNLFPTSKIVTLYQNGDVISSSSTKRDLTLEEREFNSSEAGILNSLDGSELSPAKQILAESRVIGVEQGILWSSGPEMVNISTPATKITGLMRRQNPDAEMQDDGQQPDFSLAQSLTCPATQCASPGSSNSQGLPACPSVLPDFRCKFLRQITRMPHQLNFITRMPHNLYTNYSHATPLLALTLRT
jgi:hypothetical protein